MDFKRLAYLLKIMVNVNYPGGTQRFNLQLNKSDSSYRIA